MDEYGRRPNLIEGPVRQEWVEHAACLGSDVDVFFPGRGARAAREAKRICATCTVRADCLDYALEAGEEFGVFGGLTEKERRLVKKARRVA